MRPTPRQPTVPSATAVAQPQLGPLAGTIYVLAFLSIMITGVTIEVAGAAVSLERVLGLILIVAMVIGIVVDRRPYPNRSLLYLWLAWCGVLVVSAAFTKSFESHIAFLVLTLVPIAYFWFIGTATAPVSFIHHLARALLWINCSIGSVSWLATLAGQRAIVPPMFIDSIGRLRLLTLEPNLLGSTLGFIFLLTLPRSRFSLNTCILYGLTAITLFGALSKMPLIALVVCLAIYAVLRAMARRSDLTAAIVVPIWLGALGAVVLLAFLPSVQKVYASALERQDAVSSRTYVLNIAIRRFWESPLFGRGPGDFKLQNINILRPIGGQNDENNLWIAQMMINILHDSGIVGLAVYIVFLVALIRAGTTRIIAGSIDHCGYVAAFMMVFLCSQASSVHLNAIFGIAAGLVAFGARGVSRNTVPKRLPAGRGLRARAVAG